jgi:hypothetical protein
MRYLIRIITLLGISLTSLFATRPVLAFPPMPSSFYGTVKVDGVNVPDGTPIQALINGQIFATGQTQTYQGDSVYSLDIPGDDTSTAVVDGGQDGDKIVFTINGGVADQTGTWNSATNINLNLSASRKAPEPTLRNTSSSIAAVPVQASILPTQTISAPTNSENDAVDSSKTIVIVGIVVASMLLIAVWQILIHIPKV